MKATKYQFIKVTFFFTAILSLFSACKEYTIEGYVKGYPGVGIPNASVAIRNSANKVISHTKTNSDGFYQLKVKKLEPFKISSLVIIHERVIKDTTFLKEEVKKNKGRIVMPTINMTFRKDTNSLIYVGRILDDATGKPLTGVKLIDKKTGLVLWETNNEGYYVGQDMFSSCPRTFTKNFTFELAGYQQLSKDSTFFVPAEGIIADIPDLRIKKEIK